MDKVERDGKVAVLVSPGRGAGWSSWNRDEIQEAMCMDARIVTAFLEGGPDRASEVAKQVLDGLDICVLGAKDLRVAWIERGDQFQIHSLDGDEYVRGPNREWMVA